jgi:N-acetylglucosaminyldiphosphoundecaprenol N-acetyl-beta-D-mannosaminyltransferase
MAEPSSSDSLPADALPRTNVAGVGVSQLTLARARDLILGVRGRLRCGYICLATAHGVVAAGRDPALRRAFNGSWLTTPDGMPLVWLSPAGVGRVYGPDLMLAVCEAGRAVGLTHYFLGGGPGVAGELSTRLQARFPGLQVVGCHTPPYRTMTTEELAAWRADVARERPDVVWVGLGTPKQELFMAEQWRTLDAGTLVGVGAAFDFHSGRVAQAPRWMRNSGLEWLFRLATEPRRLVARYLRTNPAFVLAVLAQRTGLREYPTEF